MRARHPLFMFAIHAAAMVAILVFTPTVASQTHDVEFPSDTVRLYVEISTSSDHTMLHPAAGVATLFGTTTAYSPDCEAGVGPDGLFLGQGTEAAENGKTVRAEAVLEVSRPESGFLEFELSRGHIGRTTVRVHENVAWEAQLLGEFVWDGINETSNNRAEFALRARPPAPLHYPVDEIDAVLAGWIDSIEPGGTLASQFYWPDAERIRIVGDDAYQVRNAVQAIREEEANPNEEVDYSLIEFSPPLRFPALEDSPPKYVTISSYDGIPGGADVFWFEERAGGWRIADQVWKIGIDYYGE